MKRYKIKKVMTTMISMQRWKIITREKTEKYCNGQEIRKYSVNDDLEALFEDLRLGNEPNEEVETYFLPKLTENELKLVEKELKLVEKEKQKRRFYLRSFYDGGYWTLYVGASRDSVRALYEAQYEGYPDVPEAEMRLSESNSKYVDILAWRKTFTIHNSTLNESKLIPR